MAEIEPRISYPWSTWMNGKEHTAKAGVDFRISPIGFRNNLYTKASLTEPKGTHFVVTKVNTKAKPATVTFKFYTKGNNGNAVPKAKAARKRRKAKQTATSKGDN